MLAPHRASCWCGALEQGTAQGKEQGAAQHYPPFYLTWPKPIPNNQLGHQNKHSVILINVHKVYRVHMACQEPHTAHAGLFSARLHSFMCCNTLSNLSNRSFQVVRSSLRVKSYWKWWVWGCNGFHLCLCFAATEHPCPLANTLLSPALLPYPVAMPILDGIWQIN